MVYYCHECGSVYLHCGESAVVMRAKAEEAEVEEVIKVKSEDDVMCRIRTTTNHDNHVSHLYYSSHHHHHHHHHHLHYHHYY